MKHRNEQGFTLVEMMVVVAILGLLAAVAIPNFKKYQARAKTTEAKLQLAAIYTAEQSFFGEYGIYSNCLRYMGYDPSSEISSRYYMTGFPGASGDIHVNGYSKAVTNGISTDAAASGGCANGTASVLNQTWFPAGKSIGTFVVNTDTGNNVAGTTSSTLNWSNSQSNAFVNAASPGIGDQSTGTLQTFRAIASGFIDQDYAVPSILQSSGSSIFSMNQEKRIFNPRHGY